MYEHDTKTTMICDDYDMTLCNEGINTPIICNDSGIAESETRLCEGKVNDRTKSVMNYLPEREQFQDSVTRLDKNDWWYLVQTLEEWGVFKPRAVVKKNPVAAWKCMNLAKDNYAKSKGAYFMICFKKELAKAEGRALISRLESRLGA